MNDDLIIKPIESIADCLVCEDIQRRAWNVDDLEVVPTHLLRMVHHSGGALLGAYLPEGTLIGFVMGTLGRLPDGDPRVEWMGTPYVHTSHMMGVLPGYRNRHVGYRLKLAQRDRARAQGLRLMTWTYDPLRSLNAHLNIARLGAICRCYHRDYYGTLAGINAGLPTDRFEVEWWLDSQHAHRRLAGHIAPASVNGWLMAGAELVNPSEQRPDGLRVPSQTAELPDMHAVLIETPADLQAIKEVDMGLARAWQEQARTLFEGAFIRGYVVTHFLSEQGEAGRRSYYVLLRHLDIAKMAGGTDAH